MMTESRKARKIPASRELQSRIGTGAIKEDIVVEAQNVIESNNVDFVPMAKQELGRIVAILRQVDDGTLASTKAVKDVALPIMNLKANAATFGYPVIGHLTASVLNLIEEFDRLNGDLAKIIDNMHKAVLVALMRNMRGEMNESGALLVSEFQKVCQAYLLKAGSSDA